MNYIKRIIFEKFFKSESYMIRSYERERNDLVSMNFKLDKLNKDYKLYHEKLLYTFKRYNMVLGLEKNKKDDSFIVACNSDDSQIDIYLIHPFSFKGRPTIQSIMHTDYSSGERSLEITDVQVEENSIGNGNIMMEYFLKEARRNKVKYIYGKLALVDKDNFCRSVPYYKKHGFEVKLNDEKTSGSIKLCL